MKPFTSLLVLSLLCACSREQATTPESNAAPQATAAKPSTAREAPVATPDTTAAGGTDASQGASSDTSSTPPDARGIAVGEPHPSGDVPVDAGPARYDGYGDLRFGMTPEQARKAWKGGLEGDALKSGECGYLHPAGTAAGPYLMFEGGVFVRYDVRGANTTAPGGGRVGLAADDIRRLYAGRVQESPHHYVEGGKYLRVADPTSKDRALIFEVDAPGRVTTWRAGRLPQVGYIEGCS